MRRNSFHNLTLSKIRKYLPAGRRGRKIAPRALQGDLGGRTEGQEGKKGGGGGGFAKKLDRILPSQWKLDNMELYKK